MLADWLKTENKMDYSQLKNKYECTMDPERVCATVVIWDPSRGPKIYDSRSVVNIVTYVYAKFLNYPLRINKALGIFRKG